MAIVAYDTIVPDVQIYARGAPAPTIVDALRRCARQFFYESLAYRSWLAAFDLTISTSTYTLPALPAQTELCQIMGIKCQGVDVVESTHEQFFALDGQWPSKQGSNAQYYTTLTLKGTFDIIPIPAATVTAAFNAQVAVMPTWASTGIEQKYLDEFRDAMIDGALARLLAQPQRPWTDERMAVVRLTDFQRYVTMAKIQASKGNIRADLGAQMRRWV